MFKLLALVPLIASMTFSTTDRGFMLDNQAEIVVQTPSGWKSEDRDGVRLLVPGDLKEGQVFTVMIPPLGKKVGSLKGLIEEGKKALGEVGKFTAISDAVTGKTESGWDFELLLGTIEVGQAKILGQVVALRNGDAGEGVILAISESAETMQKYGDQFGSLIRSVGGKKNPTSVPPGSSPRPQFTVPQGWDVKDVQGAVLLEKWENKDDETFGTRRLYRVFIGNSESLKGSLKSSFLSYWNREIKPNYNVNIVPLPMMRRLKSGLACAFDGDDAASTKEGVKLFCNAYLLALGDRYVPVIGIFVGGSVSNDLERDLNLLFESMKMPGSGEQKVPIFDASAFVGKWNTSSSALATYVTSSGGYAGDATVASGLAFTLTADGKFESWLGGVGRGIIVRESDAGSWKVSDTSLIFNGKSSRSYRIYGVGSDPKIGSFLVLSQFPSTDEVVDFSYPRRPLWGMWLKKS